MPRFAEQKLYIDGRYVDASSGATFESINPATGEVLAQVQRASQADVERAVASATAGQKVWDLSPIDVPPLSVAGRSRVRG